jgi:hypothetical protein
MAKQICQALYATVKVLQEKAADTVYCSGCGLRRKSRGEAKQVERDEACVVVCSACGGVCDEGGAP